MISVGIFAKPPHPGLVKTRLIPDLGADNAARIYRYCLEYTLEVVRKSELEFRIYLSDLCDESLLQSGDYSLQQGPDLGTRMLNAIKDMLTMHTDGAIIIGSDCLDITPTHLLQAARALANHELVLLPALDGGYALIGCTRIEPGLFRDISWSSEQVLEQTLINATQLNYRVSLLETVRDIDTLQDVKQYPELLALIT
jgi:hypothetical protein